MANKSILLMAAGGVALFLLPKKKKTTRTAGKKPSNGNGAADAAKDGDIVESGKNGGWSWQVRKAKTLEGFSDQYFGEIQAPDSKEWVKAHQDGRTDPKAAKHLALEAIATRIAEAETPEDNLVVDSGSFQGGWKWRVMQATPIEGFAAGFFGEIQAPDSEEWTRVHKDSRSEPEEARLLAVEAIAEKVNIGG